MFVGFVSLAADSKRDKCNSNTTDRTRNVDAFRSILESTCNLFLNWEKLRLNIVLTAQHSDSKLEVYDMLGNEFMSELRA